MATIKVTLADFPPLPLFWPGERIALFPCAETSGTYKPTGAPRRRSASASRRRRPAAFRNSIAIGHVECGADRIQLRLIRRRSGGDPTAPVHCRLTGFLQSPDAVDRLARSLGRRELHAAQQTLIDGGPGRHLDRELRVQLLLSLHARRQLSAGERRHPLLVREWRKLVRHEHRRMLKRLRHAVRRLQRVLESERSSGQAPRMLGRKRNGSPRTSKSGRSATFITSPKARHVVSRLDPP